MRQIRKILIIDDKSSAALTRQILLSSGVVGTVDDFDSARQALRYIVDREFVFPDQLPDLALLELDIPGDEAWKFLDGYARLSQELKEKIHLVVLTSSGEAELLNDALIHPDTEEIVEKPITKEKVLDLQLKIWEGLKK